MTVSLLWLWWLLAVVIMFLSAVKPGVALTPRVGITLFHLAWAFALLAVAWPVLTR